MEIKLCSHAGCSKPARPKGKSVLGVTAFAKYCHKHYTVYYDKKYRLYKKQCCELCGFIPQHQCQLDVDHKDSNRKNNEEDNLQTLCANCHRLKTHLHNDYIKKQPD